MDLSDPAVVRGVARRFGVGMRQRLGQHFLVDAHYRRAILAAAGIGRQDHVLEIGPGIGSLTQLLWPAAHRVLAIEIDPGCVAALRATCQGATNLEVLQADIRKTDTGRLFGGHRYRVVGNLPYYLTGMVLPQLLSATPPPADVTVLVQREVAQRLAGPPGDWSLATLGVRILADAALLLAVPAAAFMPPPRVASALIRLTPKSAPAVPPGEQPSFFAFAEAFFQARRKQLHHAWAHATGATPARARESLRQLGIDPARRPQTLSLAEWTLLYRRAAGGKVGGTIRA